ncbi:Glutaredoxin 3 [Sparganum proliferum]
MLNTINGEERLKEFVNNNRLVSLTLSYNLRLSVLYISATWAPQCSQICEVVRLLSNDPHYSSISFAEVDAESVENFCKEHQIQSVPAVLSFSDGREVGRVNGAKAAEITKVVVDLAAQSDSPAMNSGDLNSRIKTLINQAPIMLFMKGSPEEPRCGFSKQIVAILSAHNVKYGYFDILKDDDIRQGLKKYSDWPTYPQLYVDGELVGGLDIVKQLEESGGLLSALHMV